jgi:hypothetical protein
MSIIGEALGTVEGAVAGAGESVTRPLTGSSASAAVPRVHGGPAHAPAPARWLAPDASGSGQVTVHRDVLRAVAAAMRSDLQELDKAVRRLPPAGATSLVQGWPIAIAFSGNAANASVLVTRASNQRGIAHLAASKNLIDTATTYDGAESDSQRAVGSVSALLNAMSGTLAAAGGG